MTKQPRLFDRKKQYLIIGIILFLLILTVVDYASYGRVTSGAIQFWHSGEGQQNSSIDNSRTLKNYSKNKKYVINDRKLSYDEYWNADFNIRSSDVMVFLHIQKTGGSTFGKHLVKHLQLSQPCKCQRYRKKCRCYRPNSKTRWWLFSRYSTGWICGLHADWTELTSCVDGELDKMEGDHAKRRYFYITLLREPISRYLSEFKHVQRGATWKETKYWCGGRKATRDEVPFCYNEIDWAGVTFQEFTNCSYNMANNRQTRMLADLSLVSCYDTSAMSQKERNIIILASAKENLRKMAYFGLCEYQQISQYMFEKTFNLHFKTSFVQFNETHVSQSIEDGEVNEQDIENIKALNYLDIQLYEYAKDLLLSRHQAMLDGDPDYNSNFNN